MNAQIYNPMNIKQETGLKVIVSIISVGMICIVYWDEYDTSYYQTTQVEMGEERAKIVTALWQSTSWGKVMRIYVCLNEQGLFDARPLI